MNIYYYHPLDLSFTSAQTLQVVRDAVHLSRQGHRLHLYGTWRDRDALMEVETLAAQGEVRIAHRPASRWHRLGLKLAMLGHVRADRSPKLLITRTLDKARELARLKPILGHHWTLTEMHEECFPYLFKPDYSRARFQRALHGVDLVLFTGPAQASLYRQDWGALPPRHLILPNGVELERFRAARRGDQGILTYLGQFNPWKNLELLFQALALLPPPLRLRVAGGKAGAASQAYIETLTHRHGLVGRVDYLGYVPGDRVVERVLDGSSALLLPLGDNPQSRYLTSPMKLFEYMATPIPVVAVDFPSVRELAGPEALYLAEPTPTAFAAAIRAALEDPEGTPRIARMNRLAEGYSHTQRAARLHAALLELCHP